MAVSEGVEDKRASAIAGLRAHRRVVVALSGGVDSAVLLSLARQALGAENVLAITARSAAVSDDEIEDARRVAQTVGVAHEVIATHELDRPEYRANRGDRCFHCRTELFEQLSRTAGRRGFDAVAYGAILDDLGDHRPGMEAARQWGVIAPLLEARISKIDVRELAKTISVHISEKPASACLASRIPIGTEVTPERLSQIDRAESALRSMGFHLFRVRHHGDVARIEIAHEEFDAIAARRLEVARAVASAGFRFVALDLEGYRTGSLNPAPPRGDLYSIAPARDGGQ